MQTPQILRARLVDAGSPTLRAWVSDSWLLLDGAIQRALAEVAADDGWTLDHAIAWMQNAARGLIDTTVIIEGKMAKDDYGASGSTFEPLKNYVATGPDAPLAVHADALELLRVHSRGQLRRDDFDRAYEAVERAMRAAGKPMPREGVRTYIHDPVHAKGLKGGGAYAFDRARKQITVETGPSKAVAQALRTVLRGKANYRAPYAGDFTIVVQPDAVEAVADEFERLKFTELADAMRKLAPHWRKELGVREPDAVEAERRVEQAAQESTNSAERGVVAAEGTRWVWEPDAFRVRLYGPIRSIDVAKRAGNGVTFASDDTLPYADPNRYFTALPTRPELMDTALTGLARVYPATAAAMRPYVPTWTATRSSLKQDRESGRTEEGSWELITRKKRTTRGVVAVEYLRIYTLFLRDPETGEAIKWWRSVPGADPSKHDGKRFSVEVPVKRVNKLVTVLRNYFPRLAEAISRAYGGVAGVVDEEAEACAALINLHDKLTPEQVTNEDAIEALDYVRRAFAARVPAGLSPLPFQTVGIAFAKLTGYRALIGDAPGLGKTIQGLGCLITDPETLLPAVIVAPKNVTVNWMKESRKWLPTVPTKLIETVHDEIPAGNWKGVSILSWEMMVAHMDEIIAAGTACVIADEAHYAKNPTAQRTKALITVLEKVPHALLLTGTPIKNVVVELHTLLAALDAETWGTRKAFADQYVEEQKKVQGGGIKYIGVKEVDPLQQRLACSMVRRLKEDALKDLPPKQRVYFTVSMTPEQRAEYEQAEEDFEAWYVAAVEKRVREELAKAGVDENTASEQARDQATAKAEAYLRAQAIVKLGEMRRIVGQIKTQPAIDLAKKLVAEGENVVIFAAHKPVVKGIARALDATGIPYGVIDGDASAQERAKATDDFQAGRIRVIVASEAAKEGLTLTRAANTIFVERYWTPADEQQAEDRIHRIGQTRAVVITYLHVPGTVDDTMHALIETKRALVDRVLGDDDIEEQDRNDTQADFVRFLIKGRGKPPPVAVPMRPVAEAGNALAAKARANPSKISTVRRGDVQTLMFDKRAWTRKTAAHWLRVNGYRVVDPQETTHYLVYEQKRADFFLPQSFRTVHILSSVRALVGKAR